MSGELWNRAGCDVWGAALDGYASGVRDLGEKRLPELDAWYRAELPGLLAAREPAYLTRDELIQVVEWKMRRGVYRARNLLLVESNSEDEVRALSGEAFGLVPHPTAPIARLAKLAGVGPATASAALAAYRPDLYPFFDDVVAALIPDFGKVDFTLKCYARYAERLHERSALLAVGCPGAGWTPDAVARALWSSSDAKK
ncbi:MAG: hypothetical protein U0821_19190 [Chloroflexota bacterium]